MSNPFWDFSLVHYAIEGVSPACLSLQDDYGLDVNVLLYAAWWGAQGLLLDEAHLAILEAEVAPWREQVVRPLRGLRRQWRQLPAAAELRDGIAELELLSERKQQDLMYALATASGDALRGPDSIHANLCLVARSGCAGETGWEEAVNRLAELIRA